ncbi:MAG: SGNH/GDSL hydrolase family protein [Gemmatimonadota bacterium]|nr:MAG: SGNH/GDSL hydrolase family protein [Gemmatimonadota bacterium]
MDSSNNLSRFVAGALVALLTLTSACDRDSLQPPTASNVSPSVQSRFTRYVALGNSITAGLQSGGINDSTQLEAYPVLLARQMGLQTPTATTPWTNSWNTPLMRGPGCPPPYTNIFTQERLDGAAATACDYRDLPIPTFVNNVAFPGADVVETYSYYDPSIVPSATDIYKTFLLGGQTQIQAARATDPTFLTIWIGNGDILDALLDETNPGSPDLYPAPAEFIETYAQMMDSVDTFQTVSGGVLIGVVQVTAAPYASVGGAYYLASQTIPTLTVDLNCLAKAEIPGTSDSASVLIPFHYGAPIMGAAALGVPQTIDCSVDEVISPVEAIGMIGAVTQYNAAIAAEATERDWIYLDPNVLLAGLAQDTAAIRPFPAFAPTHNQHQNEPFGWALSLDGLHPSARSHVLVADALIDAINAKYGASIPNIVQQ